MPRPKKEESQNNQEGLTPDEQLIADNPGASAYELLQKGLSPEMYDQMQPGGPKAPQTVKQSSSTIISAKPALRPFTGNSIDGRAELVETATGSRTKMTRDSAERMVRKYPTRYTVE